MTKQERLAEARKMRGDIIKAIDALVNRGAKSWNIGGQTYTSIDLSELQKMLQYWDNIIAELNGGRRTFRRVVPMDD